MVYFLVRFVFLIFSIQHFGHSTRFLPMIVWDHINPILSCKCNWPTIPYVTTYDRVDFVCPTLKIAVKLLDGYSRPTGEMNENLFRRRWPGSVDELKNSIKNGLLDSFCDPNHNETVLLATCHDGTEGKSFAVTFKNSGSKQEEKYENGIYVFFNNGDGSVAALRSTNRKCSMVFAVHLTSTTKVDHDISYGKCLKPDGKCDEGEACNCHCPTPTTDSVRPTPTPTSVSPISKSVTSTLSSRISTSRISTSRMSTRSVPTSSPSRQPNRESEFICKKPANMTASCNYNSRGVETLKCSFNDDDEPFFLYCPQFTENLEYCTAEGQTSVIVLWLTPDDFTHQRNSQLRQSNKTTLGISGNIVDTFRGLWACAPKGNVRLNSEQLSSQSAENRNIKWILGGVIAVLFAALVTLGIYLIKMRKGTKAIKICSGTDTTWSAEEPFSTKLAYKPSGHDNLVFLHSDNSPSTSKYNDDVEHGVHTMPSDEKQIPPETPSKPKTNGGLDNGGFLPNGSLDRTSGLYQVDGVTK